MAFCAFYALKTFNSYWQYRNNNPISINSAFRSCLPGEIMGSR